MINKASKGRVKNATKVSKYGIDFKSRLECYTYEALTNAGIPVKYEPKHFELVPKFEFSGTRIWNGVWTVNKKMGIIPFRLFMRCRFLILCTTGIYSSNIPHFF